MFTNLESTILSNMLEEGGSIGSGYPCFEEFSTHDVCVTMLDMHRKGWVQLYCDVMFDSTTSERRLLAVIVKEVHPRILAELKRLGAA